MGGGDGGKDKVREIKGMVLCAPVLSGVVPAVMWLWWCWCGKSLQAVDEGKLRMKLFNCLT